MPLLEVNARDLSVDALAGQLAADRRAIRVQLSRAINETTRHMRSFVSRALRQTLPLSKKFVDKHLQILAWATPDALAGYLDVADRGKIPLRLFRPRQTAAGVTVLLDKTAPRQLIAGAFGPKIDALHGGIFRRAGRARLPIAKLFDVDVTGGDTGAVYRAFEASDLGQTASDDAGEFLERRVDQRLKLQF